MNNIIRTLAVALMLSFGATTYAQVSIGAGYVSSTLTNAIYTNEVASNLPYHGFYVGVGYTIPIVAGLSITPGVFFESIRANHVTDMQTFELRFSGADKYLSVPLYVSYGFDLSSSVRLSVFAGPTATLGLSSVNKGYEAYKNSNVKSEETVTEAYKEGYWKRFDVMLGGGLGIELLKHIRITVAVNFGMIDRQITKMSDLPMKRNQLVAGVTYVF